MKVPRATHRIIHCRSENEAKKILEGLKSRMKEVGLEIHSDKSKIVYCRSDRFRNRYENESFDFLGYTFRRRHVKNKKGNFFNTFSPAVSKEASKSFREKIRSIRRECKALSLESLAEMLNPVIRGWMNYFMAFRSREARKEVDYVNQTLVQWVKRKYKTTKRSEGKAWRMIARIAKSQPTLFYHWEKGIRPTIG